jgi:hypothetical protein
MEWVFLAGCLAWILALAFFFPNIFATRCPFCSTRLEFGDFENWHVWKQWRLGWRRLYCPSCMYAHRRPIIRHETEKVNHEASIVR